MVGILLEPGRELGIARPVAGGEIALGQDMADETVIAHPAEKDLGVVELAGILEIEDLAVAVGIGEAERLGQGDRARPLVGKRGERGRLRTTPSVGAERGDRGLLGAHHPGGEGDARRDQKWSQYPCPPPARPGVVFHFSLHRPASLTGKRR